MNACLSEKRRKRVLGGIPGSGSTNGKRQNLTQTKDHSCCGKNINMSEVSGAVSAVDKKCGLSFFKIFSYTFYIPLF